MFFELKVSSFIRVPPSDFQGNTGESVLKRLNHDFENFISEELGIVLGVSGIDEISEGIIIPGDGAAYYETKFRLLTFKPELQEVLLGEVSDITDFGAFLNIGALDGMIHVSQTMDDYVSFSKSNVLTGKESKKILKVSDKCRARIIAISYKDLTNPKIGLTMRQQRLGNLKWIEEEIKKQTKEDKEKK